MPRRRRPGQQSTYWIHHALTASCCCLLFLLSLTKMISALPQSATGLPSYSPSHYSSSSSNLFCDLSEESLLSRTMIDGRHGESGRGDPHSIKAPGAESLRLSHGTTTVALVCRDGVVAAVDSRASMGSFVGSRTTQKVGSL